MNLKTLDKDDKSDPDDGYDDDLEPAHILPPRSHPRPISEKTAKLYASYVKTLRKRYMETHPEAHVRDVTPLDLVENLLAQTSNLRPKTFGSYRSGLLHWLNTIPSSPYVLHARLVLDTGVPLNGYKGTRPGKTASLYSSRSQRPRTFSRKNFEKLAGELNRRAAKIGDGRSNRRAGELLMWLRAGLASGVRPAEWETATWQDKSKGELLVHTAKAKLAYALPSLKDVEPARNKTRVVMIDPDAIIWVDQHLIAVRKHLRQGRSFNSYYQNNRMYLSQTCIELFGVEGPRFTLYMMRGQFAANRKRSGKTIEQVGAEMGCNANTASTCYGNRVSGHHGAGVTDAVTQNQQARIKESESGGAQIPAQ